MEGDGMMIGVLYPGEMGAALSAGLCARGLRVVSTLANRSPRTAGRCRGTAALVLGSLADVVRQSRVVISTVSPAAALEVAREYCLHARLAPAGAIYVDANAVSPALAQAIAAELSRHGIDFVDAAVNGLAATLPSGGTMFLSGERAGEVARLFEGVVRTRVLGERPGRASAIKMLLSGVSKGLCALFMELELLSRRGGMSPEFFEELSRIYPGIASVVNRMLPTYAKHAGRRADEMSELAETARAAGMEPCMIESVGRFHEALANSPALEAAAIDMTARSLLDRLADGDFLMDDSLTARQERAC